MRVADAAVRRFSSLTHCSVRLRKISPSPPGRHVASSARLLASGNDHSDSRLASPYPAWKNAGLSLVRWKLGPSVTGSSHRNDPIDGVGHLTGYEQAPRNV